MEADKAPSKADSDASVKEPLEKKSAAVFDRRSVVFGPGDMKLLDDLVWSISYHKWGAQNRSTIIRALIRVASEAYGDQVFPKTEPWALHLHERMEHHLKAIKKVGAKRGPKP